MANREIGKCPGCSRELRCQRRKDGVLSVPYHTHYDWYNRTITCEGIGKAALPVFNLSFKPTASRCPVCHGKIGKRVEWEKIGRRLMRETWNCPCGATIHVRY